MKQQRTQDDMTARSADRNAATPAGSAVLRLLRRMTNTSSASARSRNQPRTKGSHAGCRDCCAEELMSGPWRVFLRNSERPIVDTSGQPGGGAWLTRGFYKKHTMPELRIPPV